VLRLINIFPLAGTIFVLAACTQQTLRKDGFEVHGIDVSHYQRQIDWPLVATQDIHFAFVKATEGETLRDPLFSRNWHAAKDAGLKRGAYHFFRPAASPEKQAKNFLEAHLFETGDLLPVLDVEVTDEVNASTLRKRVATWLRIVEKKCGAKPIIYTNQKFFNQYLAGHFDGYPVWVARYNSFLKPRLHKDSDWHFWQYGNQGKLKGIKGPVDFNVFNGSLQDLERFTLHRSPQPAAEPTAVPATVVQREASPKRRNASQPAAAANP
jgi:lysozyme